jgi:hypothetical protein
MKKSHAPSLSHRRHRAIGERAIDLDKKRPLQGVSTSGVVQINRDRRDRGSCSKGRIWGQGDGSGLCAVDSKVGRVGQWPVLSTPD